VAKLAIPSPFLLFLLGEAQQSSRSLDQAQEGPPPWRPIVPYLFILTIDTLQDILNKATEEGLLSPLQDRAAHIQLFLYADNAAVFLNPVRREVDLIMAAMQHFGEAMGLCINVNKNTATPIHCSRIDLDSVLQNFSWSRVPFAITYFGLSVMLGRLRMVHLQPVQTAALHSCIY
jgi:hypothetical protein